MELDTEIEGSLYSMRWDEDQEHTILDQMAIDYTDGMYLNQYFEENQEKLKYYDDPTFTPLEAAIKTQREANALIQELKDLATAGLENSGKSLDDLFVRLHSEKAANHPRYYTDVKAKGHPKEAPWLRVYAIRCDENLYVITGYGIKLTRDMRDDPELLHQLKLLERATSYLDREQMIYRP